MRQVTILDEDTYTAAQAALVTAKRHGWDQVEVLHQRNLLLSPAVRRHVQVAALVALEQDLGRWQPHEMLRRVRKVETGTPADMYLAMMGYLADYIKTLKEER